MSFPLDRMDEIGREPERFRLIEQAPFTREGLTWTLVLNAAPADVHPVSLVLLDLETTGLDPAEERLIELGAVRLRVNPVNGQLLSIEGAISWYDDPDRPIPAFITDLTGITDADVAGQRIDDMALDAWLGHDPIMVAHNAAFDRPFMECRFAVLGHYRWGCSLKEVDWRQMGFEGSKLEYLLLKCGYFYTGHHAVTDCLALAQLLHAHPEATLQLLHAVEVKTVKIQAFGAPFDVKDRLKANGYQWFPEMTVHPSIGGPKSPRRTSPPPPISSRAFPGIALSALR
jgi:DNA polymerase-3 subunit epsilon